MNEKRVKQLKKIDYKQGDILYWMSRDQRVEDNWALLRAQELAKKYNVNFRVVFCLRADLRKARGTARMLDFMLASLQEVEGDLSKKHISFEFLVGHPEKEIPKYINKQNVGYLVADFSPLRINKRWYKKIREAIDIPMDIVDAHNIVPVWEASIKQEYAAQFFRKKINSRLDEFLDEFPEISRQTESVTNKTDWVNIRKTIKVNEKIPMPNVYRPGIKTGKRLLQSFIEESLENYDKDHNDPNTHTLSNLSPYVHFGQISAQRVAFEIKRSKTSAETKNAFLEQLIIRRELSDNFCYYNNNYDNWQGIPDWAKATLEKHTKDKREYVYSFRELEDAKTHDDLWNAAQIQLLREGKMHGYMRMYWAKKILEWTNNPRTAIIFACKLNDTYELDGRDPNGYVGILWSIGGLHDRPWFERDIYGTVRYMNKNGAAKKFDVDEYIRKYSEL